MKKTILSLAAMLMAFMASAQISNPVTWSYGVKKINPKEVVVMFKAVMDKDWHIYSTNQQAGGPQKTTFAFAASKNYQLLGKIAEPKPIVEYSDVYKFDLLYFKNAVVFQQKIKLVKKAVLKATVTYMVCTDKECKQATEVSFNVPVG